MVLSIGSLVDDRYRVLRLIGEGGMGRVFLAEHERIGRKVAIKVLHANFAAMAPMVVRFEREARAAARIGSPHIADVFDFGFLPSEQPYVVMEYLEGQALSDCLKSGGGRMTSRDVAPIAIQLLDGLSQVHEAGIVHRDLKPANIFLASVKGGDCVKLLDFGISKFREGLFTGPDALSVDQQMLGTPHYMSPEQARNEAVDARADVYSVGAVLYRCLTGFTPFRSDNRLQLLLKICDEPPRPVEVLAPDVEPEFGAIIRRAMAKNPAQRYPTAAAFRDAVAEWHGRLDRLLADFLGVQNAVAGAQRTSATRITTPLPSSRMRPRLVSKVVVEPEELEGRLNAERDAALDAQVDDLLDRHV